MFMLRTLDQSVTLKAKKIVVTETVTTSVTKRNMDYVKRDIIKMNATTECQYYHDIVY